MEKLKHNWYLLLIGLTTVILGVVAVVTAIKLYQVGQKPVAPTAPESKPQAAQQKDTTGTQQLQRPCQLSFSLGTTQTIPCDGACGISDDPRECAAGLTCSGVAIGTTAMILKCRNPQCPREANCLCPNPEPQNCETNFTVTKKANKTTVDTGDEITYTVTITRKSTVPATARIKLVEDGVPPPFKYIRNSTTNIGEPDIITDGKHPEYELLTWTLNKDFDAQEKLVFTYKVKVTDVQINRGSDVGNTAYVLQSLPKESGCSALTTVKVNSTSTKPACHEVCDPSVGCQNDLRCQDVGGTKRCVNRNCTSEADCVCNKSCWAVCGNSNECPSGLSCRSVDGTQRCVNPSCLNEQDCNCTTTTTTPTTTTKAKATPTTVELPQAGISLPTVGALASGIILILVGLLLAI